MDNEYETGKAYAPPQLVEYGKVTQLTEQGYGGRGRACDNPGKGNPPFCE